MTSKYAIYTGQEKEGHHTTITDLPGVLNLLENDNDLRKEVLHNQAYFQQLGEHFRNHGPKINRLKARMQRATEKKILRFCKVLQEKYPKEWEAAIEDVKEKYDFDKSF